MTGPKIDSDLQHLLKTAKDHDVLDVNIFLRKEPLVAIFESAAARARRAVRAGRILDTALDVVGAALEVVDAVKSAVKSAQSDLLSFLKEQSKVVAFVDGLVEVAAAAPVESFWITNAVGTRVTAKTLREIMERTDVAFVDVSRHVPVEELIDGKKKKVVVPKKAARKNSAKRKRAGAAGTTDDATSTTDATEIAWSVSHINAPLCWDAGLTGKGILVALVDTGVNYKHPDLKNRMWKGGVTYPKHGYDYENDDNDPNDDNGHGTATAGQVAGDGTSGTKTGVAPGATILAIRVGGVERNFWKGLQFALDQKAQVISMSMTWKYPSNPDYPGWRRVCETILAAGVLHANSIGNQGSDLVQYPIPFNIATPGNCPPPWMHPDQKQAGGLSSPISVGATDSADRLANYSGRGPAEWKLDAPYDDYPIKAGDAKKIGLLKPDVCAPGPGTISCNVSFPSDPDAKPYVDFGGTSAATPHVGGCLALLAEACLKANKPIVPAQVQEALEKSAKTVQGQTAGKKEIHYGSGRVDVYAAFKYGQAKGWW